MRDMDQDYLLIGVDLDSKVAIRFLSLSHSVEESLKIHTHIQGRLREIYARFLLSSVLVGSRMDDQESMLFKLDIKKDNFQINCEVSPKGAWRSAIFPTENLSEFSGKLSGQMQVARLKKNSQVYQSITPVATDSVVDVFQDYLEKSDQSQSLFFVHSDDVDFKKNYGLWIERLPGTALEDWQEFVNRFQDASLFEDSIANTNDPDQIIQNLFPSKMRILTVTKPQLSCTCSEEKIIDALQVLPNEDLVEIFMEGEGVETRCDYCGKVWQIPDSEIKKLVTVNKTLH